MVCDTSRVVRGEDGHDIREMLVLQGPRTEVF